MKCSLLTALAILCSTTLSCQLKTPASILEEPNAIIFSPAAGTYGASQNITLASNIAGSTICYSTDGAIPRCASESGCAAGTIYSSPIAIIAPVSAVTTTTVKAVGCKSGTATYPIASATYVLDTQPPTLLSTTPASSATGVPPCSGSPCVATITLVFNESLNTSLGQTLTMEIQTSTIPAYTLIPSTGTTFTFAQTNLPYDTLSIRLSWVHFPENAPLRFTLDAAGIADAVGNSITAPLQQIFMTTTRNVVFPVSDTGQTTCYDDTTAQACPVATHPGQDADYADTPNSRSFTGPTQNATFNTDYTTTDNSTGLIWKTCTEGLTGATCTGGSATSFTSWFNTVNPCSTLNAANGGVGYAQINTWRLPTSREAATLKNYELANPTLEAIPFPATIAGQYRSATTSLASLNFAGHYYFNAAAIAASNMGNPGYVRCVASGASNPVRNFSDNTDGTVTDVNANLRWQKCTRGQNNDASCTGAATASTWQLALQYCDGLTLGDTGFANRANWRLPNVKELESLIDRSVNSPAISTAFFPATLSNYYWTSSTVAGTPTNAWRIRGDIDNSVKTSAHYARCVATGP